MDLPSRSVTVVLGIPSRAMLTGLVRLEHEIAREKVRSFPNAGFLLAFFFSFFLLSSFLVSQAYDYCTSDDKQCITLKKWRVQNTRARIRLAPPVHVGLSVRLPLTENPQEIAAAQLRPGACRTSEHRHINGISETLRSAGFLVRMAIPFHF